MQAIFYNGDIGQAHIGDIVREVYSAGLYAPVIEAALVANPNLTILDVGANIGLTAAYFSTHAERVIAVEPCAAHVECLRELIRYNGLDNVEVVPMALSDKSGQQYLYHAPNPTSHSLMERSDGSPMSTEMVSTSSLAGLIQMWPKKITHIDILKLDAEGSESEIIDSFADCPFLPRYVVGEWHRWTRYSQVHIERHLKFFGYEVCWMGMVGDGVAESPTIFVAWKVGEVAPS